MKRTYFFLCCLLAAPWLAACAQHSGINGPNLPRPAYLDLSSQPPPQEIVPPRAIALDEIVIPIQAAQITGRWRHAGCELHLAGDGLEGAAGTSGQCQGALRPIAGWKLEPVDRARLTLVGAAGEEVWAGLYMRDGRLAGFTPDGAPLEFIR